jgi:hypothetical protein
MLRSVNMAPSTVARNKKRFTEPWIFEKEDNKQFAYVPSNAPVHGEDGDCEVLRHILEVEAGRLVDEDSVHEEDEEDVTEATVVAEMEARDVIQSMLDSHEAQVILECRADKIVPFVVYEGNQIYKSTLVSQLNGNPFLTKDHLTRVRNSIYFNNSDDYISAANASNTCFLGLGCHCAVYMVQRSNTKQSSVSKAVENKGLKKKSIPRTRKKQLRRCR